METIRLDLVEMIGWRYVIEHCISSFLKLQEERAYRAYITEALRILTENTAKYSGGSYLKKSYSEIFGKKEEKKEKTAKEIKSRIKGIFRK